MTNKRNIYITIITICAFVLVLSLCDGIFGGSRRDGSVHPPVELKALPLKIITWIINGGIPLSAVCLLADEEAKYCKGQRHSKPYMQLGYYGYAVLILILLLLVSFCLIHYVGIWHITDLGELKFAQPLNWKEAILFIILLYFPRFIILSLSISYILQLWHETEE